MFVLMGRGTARSATRSGRVNQVVLKQREGIMSAYIVEEEHINYLVNAGVELRGVYLKTDEKDQHGLPTRKELNLMSDEELSEVGQMLWDENEASVNDRYPDCEGEELPGTIAGMPTVEAIAYRFERKVLPDKNRLAQIITACHCYDYQACEHDGWENSQAKKLVDSIKGQAVRKLPGMDEAAWGAPKGYEGPSNVIDLSRL